MERGEAIVHRMSAVFPLQLEKGFKALRFEVGSSRSLPLPSINITASTKHPAVASYSEKDPF